MALAWWMGATLNACFVQALWAQPSLPEELPAAQPEQLLAERDELKRTFASVIEEATPQRVVELGQPIAAIERSLVEIATADVDRPEQGIERREQLIETLEHILHAKARLGDEHLSIRQELNALQDANFELRCAQQLDELSDEKRDSVRQAQAKFVAAKEHFNEHKLPEAIAAFEACLVDFEALLGPHHSHSREVRAWLPYLFRLTGQYLDAQRWTERQVVLDRQQFGAHPLTARSLHTHALVCEALGEFTLATEIYEQSLAMRLAIWGPDHRGTAIAHNALGLIRMWTGNYADAKPQLDKSLRIIQQLELGELDAAANLQNLALLHSMMGDHLTAQPLYERALEGARDHAPTRAQILDNMGLMYQSMGDAERAEQSFQQALEAFASLASEHLSGLVPEKPGDESQMSAEDESFQAALTKATQAGQHANLRKISRTLNNYASLRSSLDDYQQAEVLFGRSLAISQAVNGGEHPESAACLDNLGRLMEQVGELDDAEQVFERALSIRMAALGESHAETAVSLNSLGMFRFQRGEHDQARDLIYSCLCIRRRLLDETSAVQNERQQLLMNQSLRGTLDDWMSVVNDAAAYDEVLRWKGTVFARQMAIRTLRRRPDLKPMVDELSRISCQFARLSLQVPLDTEEHSQRIGELAQQRDGLESQLVELCGDYQVCHAQRTTSASDLQSALAEQGQVVLVDFLEYQRFVPATDPQGRSFRKRSFAAFVVPESGPIVRVELGAAEPLDQLVDEYRRELQNPLGSKAGTSAVAQALRQRIWLPVQKHVTGKDAVLVSPDGSLGKLPFAALPGEQSGTYLIEDQAIAVVPVPQAIPVLLNYDNMPEVEGNVLIVGGVDYDRPGPKVSKKASPFSSKKGKRTVPISPSKPVQVGGNTRTHLAPWTPLAATTLELSSIRDTYEQVQSEAGVSSEGISLLRAGAATESAFRGQAPKHRFIHLATHGFFAPESLVSALAHREQGKRGGTTVDTNRFIGFDPGLLSGLVLAGANNPAADGDDGVLTALEVAEMDLSGVELAVLSACETGLGRVAGGEGLLGLQRSFQIAGAKSVVASLWKVDDAATSTLMGYFYQNRWAEGLETLEALRQAQLAILNKGGRGKRITQADTESPDLRTPPAEWAGFVLSGDWR